MDINKPFYKESTRSILNFLLNLRNIFMINLIKWFQINHRFIYFLCIFSNALRISHFELVTQNHVSNQVFPILSYSIPTLFLDFFSSRLFREVWWGFFDRLRLSYLLLWTMATLCWGSIVGFSWSRWFSLLQRLIIKRCFLWSKIVSLISLQWFGNTL